MKEEKKSLEKRVRAIADSGKASGMPNAFNLPKNKENRLLHIEICQKLAELSDKYGKYPITQLVYFAVSKNAHRIPTFLDGYKKIDVEKAETIFEWLKLFADYNNNPKLFRNGNLCHVLCRFYDKYSTDTKDFKAALAKYEPNPKVLNFTMVAEGLGISKNIVEQEAEMAMATANA